MTAIEELKALEQKKDLDTQGYYWDFKEPHQSKK